MTTFASDTFTAADGTALAGRTPDVGGTWTKHPSYSPGASTITANKLRGDGSNIAVHYIDTAPASADYSVAADLDLKSSVAGDSAVVCARLSTSADTYYFFGYSQGIGGLRLQKQVAGSYTSISSYSWTGPTGRVLLDVSGTTLTAKLDGATVLGPTTDSSIAAAGRAGVRTRFAGATTGCHLDAFSADEAGASPTTASLTATLDGFALSGAATAAAPPATAATLAATLASVTLVGAATAGASGSSSAALSAALGSVTLSGAALAGSWAAFVGYDSATQGSWRDAGYGSLGYRYSSSGNTTALRTSLPGGFSVSQSGSTAFSWATTGSDVRYLQQPTGTDREARTWYTATDTPFTIRVTPGDSTIRRIRWYCLDWANYPISQTITVKDYATGTTLASAQLTSFASGKWAFFDFAGDVVFEFDRDSTEAQTAVTLGFFLDPGAAASLSTTLGSVTLTGEATAPAAGAAAATLAATLAPVTLAGSVAFVAPAGSTATLAATLGTITLVAAATAGAPAGATASLDAALGTITLAGVVVGSSIYAGPTFFVAEAAGSTTAFAAERVEPDEDATEFHAEFAT